jgi:hypothetical protein
MVFVTTALDEKTTTDDGATAWLGEVEATEKATEVDEVI